MNFTEPIKLPRNAHYGSEHYLLHSAKLGRVVTAYSKLEYFNILSLELDPEVETYCEQPYEINIVLDDKPKKAIVDMWVKYKDGSEAFQEVKYSKELSGDSASALRSQEQIRRERLWCEQNDMPFAVRTEEDLLKGDYLIQNQSVLAGLVRRYIPVDADHYNKLVLRCIEDALYCKRKKVLVNDLLEKGLLPIGNEWAHLAYMYARGMISMNIATKPLDMRTEVRLYAKEA